MSRAAGAGTSRGDGAWWALATGGIVFWFLIGFPFAHHNESYDWVAWVGTPDLAEVAWHRFFGGGGYRPLSMSLAWGLYRVGDGSLVPVQLFNFALTVLAWWTLARAAPFRRVFAVAALVSGGVLFSGYIYLFHLHGIFYGPVLLWLAVALRASEGSLSPRALALLFGLALVVALAHTYALVLGLAFVAGVILERGWLRGPRAVALVGTTLLLGLTLVVLVAPHLLAASGRGLAAVFTSFRALEVHPLVSLVSALFALAMVATTRWPGRVFAGVALATTVLVAALLLRGGVPVVFLWLVAGSVKACVHRRWVLALMLGASLGLPYAGGSGSPTYAIFTLALLTALVAVDAERAERLLAGLRPAHALVGLVALVTLAMMVRGGVPVPGLSALARPLLAERERTHQSERLLRRILASSWRDHPVRLANDALAPTETGGAIDRRRRPPTQQVCLDAYLDHARGEPDSTAGPIVLTFGGGSVPGRRLFVEPGRFAGEAVASVLSR